MAEWSAFLNFEPASAEECKAQKAKSKCPVNVCAPSNTCTNRCSEEESGSGIGAPKKILDLLGDSVRGKDGAVQVSTFAHKGTVVGFFFSGHWCPPSRTFTPSLITFYNNFKKNYKDTKPFEIVFISSDQNEAEFESYYSDMPWLAYPYHMREKKTVISKKFGVSGIPTLVLVDGGTGDVIIKDGRSIPQEDPEGLQYPWKPKPFAEVIREGKLINNEGTQYDVNFAMKGKIVGLFFSGHWCAPSITFTPHLIKAYNLLEKQGKNFEVIFCSWDKSEHEFEEYFATMPWLAVPYKDLDNRATALKKLFGVTGIPDLTILDENGKIISKNGRANIEADPECKDFPWYPKPLVKLCGSNTGLINERTTVVFITEHNSDVPDIENILLDLATEHHAKGDDQEIYFMYITNESNPTLVKELGKFLQLTWDASPILTIFDVAKRKAYVAPTTNITTKDARQFVQNYEDGSITHSIRLG